MFRYLKTKSLLYFLIASLFFALQSFEGIVEADFISALTSRASSLYDKPIQPLSGNVQAIYDLGVLNISLIFVSIMICGVIFGVIGVIFSSKCVALYIANMRYVTYDKIQQFSFQDIDKFSTPSLITRTTTDCEIINISLSFATKFLISAIFSFFFGLWKSFTQYMKFSIIYAIIFPAILVVMALIIFLALPYFKKTQINTDGINMKIRETILGIRVIKAYNLEDQEKQFFDKTNTSLTHSSYRAFSFVGCLFPIIQAGISAAIVGIYGIGYYGGNLGEIAGFLTILMQVLFAFIISIVTLVQITRAIPSFKRINEVNKFSPSLSFNEKSNNKIELGSIEFKNVSHSFNNDLEHAILKNVDIKINPKERIGIIGGTGSGKSTLINLLARLFDPTEGEVLIDGVNVKDYSFNEINSNVAIAMQPATLFSGTIKSNIALGFPDDMDEKLLNKEVEKVAKASEALEFINKKESGFDSIVEQRGKNFSGGQKQRISIARTIAKKSKIVIFDDATSALDTVTERKVQENIRKYNDATTIIVAQRISSVEELDRIIVMDKGCVVGFDTHKNLIKENKTYRSIVASQLGTDELNKILKEMGVRDLEKTTTF